MKTSEQILDELRAFDNFIAIDSLDCSEPTIGIDGFVTALELNEICRLFNELIELGKIDKTPEKG
jgi:hypothetical protein